MLPGCNSRLRLGMIGLNVKRSALSTRGSRNVSWPPELLFMATVLVVERIQSGARVMNTAAPIAA
jgi:hypothetical protein